MSTDLDTKDLARMLSLGRVVIGIGAFLAPHRFGRAWTGEESDSVTSRMAVRGLGARDVALGMGTLIALEGDSSPRGWLEAQALADGSDAFSTLSNFKEMPALRRWLMLGTAAGACYLGIKLAGELD